MNKQQWRWGVIIFTLISIFFRADGLFAPNFHGDEAIFTYWARLIHSQQDVWLQNAQPDKPPLLFYFQAMSFALLGRTSAISLIPNFLGMMLTIPLLATIGKRLFNPISGWIIAVLWTISPYGNHYATTAFTDPLMIVFLLLGICCVLTPRPRSALFAGIWMGCAFGVKYHAVAIYPIIFGLLLLQKEHRIKRMGLMGIGLLFPLGLWAWWMNLVHGSVAHWFTSGDGQLLSVLRPIASWEVRPRYEEWSNIFTSWWGIPFIVVMGCLIGLFLVEKRPRIILLSGWSILYLVGLWLVATPIYPRYGLIVLPIVTLVLGDALGRGVTKIGTRRFAEVHRDTQRNKSIIQKPSNLLIITAIIGLSWGWTQASSADFQYDQPAVGQEIATLAEWLDDAPYGTVLYDHWYSWYWRNELFDSKIYLSWSPNPTELLTDLAGFYDEHRYIVLPNGKIGNPFRDALHEANYQLLIIEDSQPSVTLYKIKQ